MSAKIYITDCDHDNINEETAVFEKAGVPFELVQCKTEDDLIAKLQDATAVCNQYAPFTEKVFAALPNLKMVVRYGVGVDNVDRLERVLNAKRIVVGYVPRISLTGRKRVIVDRMRDSFRIVGIANRLVKTRARSGGFAVELPAARRDRTGLSRDERLEVRTFVDLQKIILTDLPQITAEH